MSVVFRALMLIVGVASCAIGVSAGLKLFRETLDSPRWMIGGLSLLALIVGCLAIGMAVRSRRDD